MDNNEDPLEMLKEMLAKDHHKEVLTTCTDTSLAVTEMCLQFDKTPKQVLDIFNEVYSQLAPLKR